MLPILQIRALDLSDGAEASDILAVQRAAYRIEANLIGSDAIPPLRETLAQLQATQEHFVGAFFAHHLAGILSYQQDDTTLDICRLAVHPTYARRGIGTALLLDTLRREPHTSRVVVSTGALNTPARALYQREGFHLTGEREVAPGLRVVDYEKMAPSDTHKKTGTDPLLDQSPSNARRHNSC